MLLVALLLLFSRYHLPNLGNHMGYGTDRTDEARFYLVTATPPPLVLFMSKDWAKAAAVTVSGVSQVPQRDNDEEDGGKRAEFLPLASPWPTAPPRC